MIHRLGDPQTALDLLETAKSKVTETSMRAAIAGEIAETLAIRLLERRAPGDRDEAARLLRLALQAAERLELPVACGARLRREPQFGPPIDPSEDGPLGPLWPDGVPE